MPRVQSSWYRSTSTQSKSLVSSSTEKRAFGRPRVSSSSKSSSSSSSRRFFASRAQRSTKKTKSSRVRSKTVATCNDGIAPCDDFFFCRRGRREKTTSFFSRLKRWFCWCLRRRRRRRRSQRAKASSSLTRNTTGMGGFFVSNFPIRFPLHIASHIDRDARALL